MAAPTIHSSKKNASLNALFSKEITPKVTRKNILCPASQEWPRVPKHVEEHILTKLTEKLTSIVNVFKPVKKSSPEDKCEKSRIRSQLEIGTSGVFRALERNTLACVLISGQATPAITVDHIISLGQERGCPLLCLDQLAPTVAVATKSKCLPLAIGFRKMEDNSSSDFTEIVSLVKENVTVEASQSKHVILRSDQHVLVRNNVKTPKTNKYIPIKINADTVKEILGELKRTFSEALTVSKVKEKHEKAKKKQKKKRNLKDAFEKAYHCQFDIGKRTVTGILERGKLQLILLSEEILPILMSETQPCSLLSIAAEKKCPVVVLPGLMNAMRELFGGNVSVLGLKKLSCLQDGQRSFQQVLDKCLHAVTAISEGKLSQSGLEETAQQMSPKKKTETDERCPLQEQAEHFSDSDMDVDKTSTKANRNNARIVKDNTVIDNSDDNVEEDYSYLYIMKKDSKELADVKRELQEVAKSTEKDQFNADYISLSSFSDEMKFQVSNSSGKKKVKTAGTKSDSLSFKTPQASYSNSARATNSGDMESSMQKTHDFIPLTGLDTSDSPAPSPGMKNPEIDAISNKVSSKEEPQALPLFSLSRSGDSVSHTGKDDKSFSPLFSLSRSGDPVPHKGKDDKSISPLFSLSRSGDSVSHTGKDDKSFSPLFSLSRSGDSVPHKGKDDKSFSPLFSLSRSGDPVPHKGKGDKSFTHKNLQSKGKSSTSNDEDECALGLKNIPGTEKNKMKGTDYLFLGENHKSVKKANKRKLQNDDTFISFAYTESNIRTMTSDPSKKKKKKKNKK